LHVVTIDDVTFLGRNIILDGPVESGYLLSLFAGKRYFGVPTNDPDAADTNPDELQPTYYSPGIYNPQTAWSLWTRHSKTSRV
jgi:hypothetical protein